MSLRLAAILMAMIATVACAYTAGSVLALGFPALAAKNAALAVLNWIFLVLNVERQNAAEGGPGT